MIISWADEVEAEITNWPDSQYSDAGEQTYQLYIHGIEKRARALLKKYESSLLGIYGVDCEGR